MNAATKKTFKEIQDRAIAVAEQIELMRRLGDDDCVETLAAKYRAITAELAVVRSA